MSDQHILCSCVLNYLTPYYIQYSKHGVGPFFVRALNFICLWGRYISKYTIKQSPHIHVNAQLISRALEWGRRHRDALALTSYDRIITIAPEQCKIRCRIIMIICRGRLYLPGEHGEGDYAFSLIQVLSWRPAAHLELNICSER